MTPTAFATRSDRIQRTLEHLRRQSTDTTDQLVPFGPGQYTDPAQAQRERDLVFTVGEPVEPAGTDPAQAPAEVTD